jgi:Golgi nucleoside diphosphatase
VVFDAEEERGVYYWVAVNYVHGSLGNEADKTTGIVELDGNSLQVLLLPFFLLPVIAVYLRK